MIEQSAMAIAVKQAGEGVLQLNGLHGVSTGDLWVYTFGRSEQAVIGTARRQGSTSGGEAAAAKDGLHWFFGHLNNL